MNRYTMILQTHVRTISSTISIATAITLSSAISIKQLAAADEAGSDWISVGGDRGCQRFSLLKQIDRSNVGNLQVAWTYHTGELKNGVGRTIECTPLIIDGVMFVTTADRRVIALEGAPKTWQLSICESKISSIRIFD